MLGTRLKRIVIFDIQIFGNFQTNILLRTCCVKRQIKVTDIRIYFIVHELKLKICNKNRAEHAAILVS